MHLVNNENKMIGPPYEILSKQALEHYEKCKNDGENVYIDKLDYGEFMMLGELDMASWFMMQENQNRRKSRNWKKYRKSRKSRKNRKYRKSRKSRKNN